MNEPIRPETSYNAYGSADGNDPLSRYDAEQKSWCLELISTHVNEAYQGRAEGVVAVVIACDLICEELPFARWNGFLALRRLSAHVIELRAQISDRSNKRKRCHSGCHKAPTFITIIMVLIIDALIDKSSNTSMRTLACYSARANYPRPSVIRSWRRRCQWRRGSWRRTGASRGRAPHLSARRR